MIPAEFYQPPSTACWSGRVDGEEWEMLRWHQAIQRIDLRMAGLPTLAPTQKGIVLLGFACDEGVRRNKGRVGAAGGPEAIRKACSNFPVHFSETLTLLDGGDIVCRGKDLEGAQRALGIAVTTMLAAGYCPILLGGGHEITYGHYVGVRNFLNLTHPTAQIGVINFDAHFDLRESGGEGASSGTGFWQIAQDCRHFNKQFHYLAVGIQPYSNTQHLFGVANAFGVEYSDAQAFNSQNKATLLKQVDAFIDRVDHLYLTFDMDVFAAPYAPGVSATAFQGIVPDAVFREVWQAVLQSGKLISLDVAELNPLFDIDNRTAKLAATLVFDAVHTFSKQYNE